MFFFLQTVMQALVEPMGSATLLLVGALAILAGQAQLAANVPPVTMVHLVNVCGCDVWTFNASVYFLCFLIFGKICDLLDFFSNLTY